VGTARKSAFAHPTKLSQGRRRDYFAPRQRSADQRAVGALGQGRGAIEAEPRPGILGRRHPVGAKSLATANPAVAAASAARPAVAAAPDQPLLDIGEIAAERK